METSVRFLADENVAKLGRWLRILGYDVAYESPTTDARLARRAQREGRILLTRDHDFCHMNLRYFMPQSRHPLDQVKEVLHAFNLKPTREALFSRCVYCNVLVRPVPKASVAMRVPPYVYQTQQRFHECPICHQVYWRGTHVTHVEERLVQWGILPPRDTEAL